jgi:hypothetical protein
MKREAESLSCWRAEAVCWADSPTEELLAACGDNRYGQQMRMVVIGFSGDTGGIETKHAVLRFPESIACAVLIVEGLPQRHHLCYNRDTLTGWFSPF